MLLEIAGLLIAGDACCKSVNRKFIVPWWKSTRMKLMQLTLADATNASIVLNCIANSYEGRWMNPMSMSFGKLLAGGD